MGQRSFADGFRGIRIVVQPEVAGSVNAGLTVRQIQGEGLALLDVPSPLVTSAQVFVVEAVAL